MHSVELLKELAQVADVTKEFKAGRGNKLDEEFDNLLNEDVTELKERSQNLSGLVSTLLSQTSRKTNTTRSITL
jgi:hypothetical protein